MLSKEIIGKYNAVRIPKARGKVCHAPFTNLNFEQNGNVTACCFNRRDVLGKYPAQSIREIWEGLNAQTLRDKINDYGLDGGCKLCKILIESGNYSGSKAIHYDEYASHHPLQNLTNLFSGEKLAPPRVFEFEISNTCNLACTMCNGYFSSTIRKNREQLPPMPNPYDDAFVEQVAEFLPGITDLKFLGGEPFLVDIYYKIWEKVAAINPTIRVNITTNGTVFNQRVRDLLSRFKAGIVMSIDSLVPDNFEKIRQGAKLDRVLENFHHFKEITDKKNTYLGIASCAMTNNWQDLAGVVRFANDNNVSLHFNMVWNPGHLSLRYLSYDELEQVEKALKNEKFELRNNLHKRNKAAFDEMLATVSHWKSERTFTRLANTDSFEKIIPANPGYVTNIPKDDAALRQLMFILLRHYGKEKAEYSSLLHELASETVNQQQYQNGFLKNELFTLWKKEGDAGFIKLFLCQALPHLNTVFFGENEQEDFRRKCEELCNHINNMKDQQAIISDLVDDVDRKSVVNQLQLIRSNDAASLINHIEANYSG